MHQKFISCLALALTLSQLLMPAAGESYEVGINNVSALIDSNSIVLLLFYSNRCKYSVQLMPIYDTAADLLHARLGDDGKIALGKVNCDEEPEMEENYDIGKYPTIKIVRDQYVDKNEYRGQRSVSAIMMYAIMEMQDPIQEFAFFNDLLNLETQKYLVIGHYENKSHIEYEVYRRVASLLKEHCQFHVNFNSTHAPSSLTFRPHINDTESISQFTGNLSDHKDLLNWMTEKCIPIVRKLTFTNAEEITEEGKPLVILFHHPADDTSIKDFEKIVNSELLDELENVNFVTADGKLFANPVFHLNKTEEELPFIAIDSFAHMFPFPKYDDIHTPGKLKEFVTSLNTGNLHFNYHFSEFLESDNESPDVDDLLIPSLPPASKFKELRPSKHRYTFARDEL